MITALVATVLTGHVLLLLDQARVLHHIGGDHAECCGHQLDWRHEVIVLLGHAFAVVVLAIALLRGM